VKLVVVTLVGFLMSVAPASALDAPELFVRPQTWNTHVAGSDWIPLASAPVLNSLAGYAIGYRLQASGQPNEFQRVALAVTGVPDGVPSQPYAEPFCVGRAGVPGTIVEAGSELQFEGDGAYTVAVSVGAGLDCQAVGATTTGSFSVDVHVAPVLVGTPLIFRTGAQAGAPFVGVRADAPVSGEAMVHCARDGVVGADGSVSGAVTLPDGPLIAERDFPRPGSWVCAARGTTEGIDANFDTAVFTTPWSGPLRFDVGSDFRRRTGKISHPRARRPSFAFEAEYPAEASGGRVTVTLSRVVGCKRGAYKLRKSTVARGRFDAKRLRLTLTRPRVPGFYIGRFAFAGTRYLRAGVDPNPMSITVLRDRLGYATASEIPPCRLH
jgi:hypothetical protein